MRIAHLTEDGWNGGTHRDSGDYGIICQQAPKDQSNLIGGAVRSVLTR